MSSSEVDDAVNWKCTGVAVGPSLVKGSEVRGCGLGVLEETSLGLKGPADGTGLAGGFIGRPRRMGSTGRVGFTT
jgi:hypothetical protein